MPARITTTTNACFMLLTAAAAATRRPRGCGGGGAATAAGGEDGDVRALERRLLEAFELDERFAVVQNLPQLRVPSVRQIALRLDDEVIRRHADFELTLLGFELLLRELTCGLRGLDRLTAVLNVDRRVGDVGRNLQLDLLELRLHLIQLHPRARHGRFLRAETDRIRDIQLARQSRVLLGEDGPQQDPN